MGLETIALISIIAGAGVGIAAATGAFGGGGDVDIPAVEAESATRTAERVEQPQADRNKRLAASLLTAPFRQEPVLGKKTLLGRGELTPKELFK